MRSPIKIRRAIAAATLLLTASALHAQDPHPVLQLQTASGQTTFHIGERIPLILTFTTPNDTQYLISSYAGGRGAEFSSEKFTVTPPAGWSDPLPNYFIGNSMTHGWQPRLFLTTKPYELKLDLNEWVRFDQPGTYTLQASSRRVSERASSTASQDNTLSSNSIELHILPATPEWQSSKLNEIVAVIDRRNQAAEDAAADLRYLATPAAIDVMTSRLRQGYNYDAHQSIMGLIGLPESMYDLAIASLNRHIDEPDYPITQAFFETISALQLRTSSNDPAIIKQRQALIATLWQTVFAAVPRKQGTARAETVQTLTELARNHNFSSLKSQMGLLLADSFLTLDQRSQVNDLRQHWDMLRSSTFLPTLQTLAKLPPRNDSQLGPYSTMDLKSIAFKRWYELDPQGAHREILAQIGSSNPSLSGDALSFLPKNEQLPQFEALWAQAFLDTTDQLKERVLGSLLVRFGTGAATPQIIAKLNEPKRNNACGARTSALAYLVRFSPEAARSLVKQEFADDPFQCGPMLMDWISAYASGPPLNEVAVDWLNAGDPQLVLRALGYLKSYGRKSDQDAIWNHYVAWAQKWKGKGFLLDHPEASMTMCSDRASCLEIYTGGQIGRAFGLALIANQGWLADPSLIASVLARCIGQEMCRSLEDAAENAKPPYKVGLPSDADPFGIEFIQAFPSFNVAQYGTKSLTLFEAKIGQFPKGSQFILAKSRLDEPMQQTLIDQVAVILKKHGMLFQSPSSSFPN